MRATMDSAGRLVIPKEVRQQAQITPGMPLEVRLRDGLVTGQYGSGVFALSRIVDGRLGLRELTLVRARNRIARTERREGDPDEGKRAAHDDSA